VLRKKNIDLSSVNYGSYIVISLGDVMVSMLTCSTDERGHFFCTFVDFIEVQISSNICIKMSTSFSNHVECICLGH
jgi:hypothetical protein